MLKYRPSAFIEFLPRTRKSRPPFTEQFKVRRTSSLFGKRKPWIRTESTASSPLAFWCPFSERARLRVIPTKRVFCTRSSTAYTAATREFPNFSNHAFTPNAVSLLNIGMPLGSPPLAP